MNSSRRSGRLAYYLCLDDCCKRMHSRPGPQIDSTFRSDVAASQQTHRHFRPSKTGFIVQHYAGDVSYDTHGFAESNRDELRNDLFDILVASSDSSLTALYADDQKERQERSQDDGKRRWVPTREVGRSDQCSEISGGSHAVRAPLRAVREDERREARVVLRRRAPRAHQCKYLGLPENVRVRRAGFAYRTEYHRFLERFKTLSRATYPENGREPMPMEPRDRQSRVQARRRPWQPGGRQ